MAFLEATFKIRSSFQLTGRQFFILGDILSGSIKTGMIADLSSIGIDKKLMIEVVEIALHRKGEKGWEDVGIGVSGLTEIEKDSIQSGCPFAMPIFITEKNAS